MMNYLDYFKIILIDILIKNSGNKKKIQDISSKLVIEIPTKKTFGELSTNIAMVFAKVFRMSPIELAKIISDELSKDQYVRDIKIDGPGFINLFLKKKFWHQQLKFSIQNINGYEYSLKSKKICVEFVSANPTGMMHIGHARGAVLGDTISSVLEEVGHKVYREYYINDAGQQIKKLFKTIKYHINNPTANPADFPDELYPGSYLVKIAKKIEKLSKSKNEKEACQYIINLIMEDIKKDLLKIKVKHDKFVSEKELANKNNIEKLKQKLLKLGLSYMGFQDEPDSINNENWVKEKKLLFKSSKFGDDRDRALIKSDGDLTYFMTDIIYHLNKIERGFDSLVNIWGADHSGYVKRLTTATINLSDKQINFKIFLTGLVNLYDNKKILKMSKRAGNFLTLNEVEKKVGSDALRFMMISRDANHTIDFDFKLVQEKNKDNPVFYVQYAHARCKSLIRIYEEKYELKLEKNIKYSEKLELDEEIDLIKQISNFHNIILSAAKYYEPHRITNYLHNLAKMFHNYWGLGKIDFDKKILLENNIELTKSRILLVDTIGATIKKGLSILKISCPDSM